MASKTNGNPQLQPFSVADESEADNMSTCERESGLGTIDKRHLRCSRAYVAGAIIGVTVIGTCAILSMRDLWRPASIAHHKHGFLEEFVISEAAKCTSFKGNCFDSGCCLDGGFEGYQCYHKDDYYAECLETCSPDMGYEPADSWTCKESGSRSRPGCDSFGNQSDCPPERCTWSEEACNVKCSTLTSADMCEGASLGRCIWLGNGICNEVRAESESDADKCSAPGENCIQTTCCSAKRGGADMTCFQKDDQWATCLDACTPGKHGLDDSWTCEPLGNRTKFEIGCSWSGEDCSSTHWCCNEGHVCAVKDENFTGCFQTEMRVNSWATQHIDIPKGWDGTVLGQGRSEFGCQQGTEGNTAGNSLYCFMAILPSGPEGELKELARKNYASIYACDEHDVFLSEWTTKQGWDTQAATLVNTDVFIKIWQKVEYYRKYLKHDWTVKVDADAVFIPQRLKAHIWGMKPPANTAIYLKNNFEDPATSNHGFLGAIEVFSKRAMQVYFDNQEGCIKIFAGHSGEDGYFKSCMDALGVCFMLDGAMMHPESNPVTCSESQHVVYHPFKGSYDWQCCWDIAHGIPRKAEYGHCLYA